jgi:hypothetical protein
MDTMMRDSNKTIKLLKRRFKNNVRIMTWIWRGKRDGMSGKYQKVN